MPGGAGQSLVGLLLSDRTVRRGLDTSQQGRVGVGRGGGGERKRGGGSRKGDYAMVIIVIRALHFWGHWKGGMWEGETRQLKRVGVGHVLHLHPGQWGQLDPLCWTRLDRATRAS